MWEISNVSHLPFKWISNRQRRNYLIICNNSFYLSNAYFCSIMWVNPVSASPVNKRNPNFVTIAAVVALVPASAGTVLNEEPDMFHDDVIKWKHFPCYWPFVWGIHLSPVNSPHKGQWHGALMFSMICAWTNDWINTMETSVIWEPSCSLCHHCKVHPGLSGYQGFRITFIGSTTSYQMGDEISRNLVAFRPVGVRQQVTTPTEINLATVTVEKLRRLSKMTDASSDIMNGFW